MNDVIHDESLFSHHDQLALKIHCGELSGENV